MTVRRSFTSHGADAGYRSFLLRCWSQAGGEEAGEERWRFSMTEVDGDHRRWGCQGLDELLVMLRQRLAEGPFQEGQSGGEG